MGSKKLPVSFLKFAVSSVMLPILINCLPCCAESFNAQVVSVTDGDTVNVMHNGARERVILYGVDCPELARIMGRKHGSLRMLAATKRWSPSKSAGKMTKVAPSAWSCCRMEEILIRSC